MLEKKHISHRIVLARWYSPCREHEAAETIDRKYTHMDQYRVFRDTIICHIPEEEDSHLR